VPGGFGVDDRRHNIPALMALVGELAARHEVHVFSFVDPGEGGDHFLVGAHIHRVEYPWFERGAGLWPRGMAFVRLGAQIARGLWRGGRAGHFDCLHAFWANEPGLLAGSLGRSAGIPVVLSVAGGESVWIPDIAYGGAATRTGRALTSLSLRMAGQITVGTEYARSFLPQPFRERAQVIPLGISCAPFEEHPRRRAGPPWRLLHVANLNVVKDQQTLLSAFAQVASRMGDVVLDCVGADALGGGVQTRARELGLGDRVRFHGLLPPEQLVSFYRGAHLLVLSSRYESQGVVVLEAGAAGLPTVGTAVGLLPTLAPRAAWCVPAGQPVTLARAICDLLGDEPRRQAMGAAAQEFARIHDCAATARAFEKIYARLASEGISDSGVSAWRQRS
jgi:glycosyltransferase involved in cell wall biosynthesis